MYTAEVRMPADTAMKVLLETAKVTVSEEEFEKFVDIYPVLRAQADGLYLPHLEDEAPAVSFDPTVDYRK
jgi:hypothetical protein